VSGSGIGWTICKSAPRSREITTPAPHHSVFYRPDTLPAAQPAASKHWRHSGIMKIGRVVREICSPAGRLTDRQTHRQTSSKQYSAISVGGGSTNDNIVTGSHLVRCCRSRRTRRSATVVWDTSGWTRFSGRRAVPLQCRWHAVAPGTATDASPYRRLQTGQTHLVPRLVIRPVTRKFYENISG